MHKLLKAIFKFCTYHSILYIYIYPAMWSPNIKKKTSAEREENWNRRRSWCISGIVLWVNCKYLCLLGVPGQCQKPSQPLFSSIIWTIVTLSLTLPGSGKVSWLYYPHSSSKPFSVCIPLLHTAYSRNSMCIILSWDTFLYIFLLIPSYVYCISKWVHLVFPSVCSVLVYHWYNSANIDP